MDKDAVEKTLGIVLVLVALTWAVVQAFSFSNNVGLTPIAIGVPTLAFATIVFVKEVLNIRASFAAQTEAKKIGNDHLETKSIYKSGGIVALGWFLCLVATVLTLGSVVGSMVFLTLFLKLYGGETWSVVLITIAIVFALLYILFIHLLGMPLYEGVVGSNWQL